MKHPVVYVDHIIEYANAAREFTRNATFEEFRADLEKKFAVFHAIEVMGEAVRRIPKDFRESHQFLGGKS